MEFNGIAEQDRLRTCLSELEAVVDKKECRAFVANNLACTARLYRICTDKGLKIGQDISVVCAAYSSGGEYLYPEIVCARLPFYTIGMLGAHDVINLIGGRVAADGYLMPCSITAGKSVEIKNI